MKKLTALILDVDGTLADTERDGHRVAFNAAFRELGLDWVWDVGLYGELLTVTGGKERLRYYADHFLADGEKPAAFDALVAELHRIKTRRYVDMLNTGRIRIRPGVKRLLTEARAAGLRLAIATTTTPENVTALLRNGLAEDAESWFDLIAAGDIVPAKKPAPDIYLWVLDRLGWRPQDCLAVEDSANGLKSSVGAGVKTIVTVSGYTARENFDRAVAVLSDLGEPGQPFHVLQGDAGGGAYVDVALLRRWHQDG
ncbi:MAG TPA: phosphatase [Betaproteobacteria bacterium]|nr:phosphatase [Betaproteobacteria bacterium]